MRQEEPERGVPDGSLTEGLDREVRLPTEVMLSLLALSGLDRCDRHYTLVGGWLKGFAGLALSALLLPILFFSFALPVSALSRLIQRWSTQSPSAIDALVVQGVLDLVAALFVALALYDAAQAARRWWGSRRAGLDPWSLPLQCLAQMAPHARSQEATFFFDHAPRRDDGGWSWALQVDLGAALATARVRTSASRCALSMRVDGDDLGATSRWQWRRGPDGLWSPEGAPGPGQPLAALFTQALARGLTPALVESRASQHRLDLWHDLAPITLWRDKATPAPVQAPLGPIARLFARPESQFELPRTRHAARSLWAGVVSYWISAAAVASLWAGFAMALLPRLWDAPGGASGLLMAPLPVVGLLMTLRGALRYHPAIPRSRPRRLLVPNQPEALRLDGAILHTGDRALGVDLDAPFKVALTREERAAGRWVMLGVEIRQRHGDLTDGPSLRFSVPVARSEITEALEALTLSCPMVRPEDFRDHLWPLLRYRAALAGAEGADALPNAA